MNRMLRKTAAFGILMAASSLANAVFLTSNTMTSPVVIDFSDQATVAGTAGPLQVGGLVGADITVAVTDSSANLWTNVSWGLVLLVSRRISL